MDRSDLGLPRRARNQVDREYAQLLNVEASARTACGVNLSTPNVDEVFERVQATGADVVQEPMDQSYGRDCAFRDPAGNMIRIIQIPA